MLLPADARARMPLRFYCGNCPKKQVNCEA
jgi:hypothetical protein